MANERQQNNKLISEEKLWNLNHTTSLCSNYGKLDRQQQKHANRQWLMATSNRINQIFSPCPLAIKT
jgi:hypothetical protein